MNFFLRYPVACYGEFHSESIADCERALRRAGLPPNIMVDCSHANSGKDPARQLDVLEEAARQILNGNRSIVGLMIESHLREGSQPLPEDLAQLRYGVSITDPCLGWPETETALRRLREKLKTQLPRRLNFPDLD